jgi:hypothetical protein
MATSCWIMTEYLPSCRSTSMVELLQPLARAGATPRNQSEATGWRSRVRFGHRHRRNRLTLIDGADAERPSLVVSISTGRPSSGFAGVAAERARHDLDQGRLPAPFSPRRA